MPPPTMILASREAVEVSLDSLPVSPAILDALYDAGLLSREYILRRVSRASLSPSEQAFWVAKYRAPVDW